MCVFGVGNIELSSPVSHWNAGTQPRSGVLRANACNVTRASRPRVARASCPRGLFHTGDVMRKTRYFTAGRGRSRPRDTRARCPRHGTCVCPGSVLFPLLIVPDATGRSRTRGPVRLRITLTWECASRPMPTSRDGVPSASGVRHETRVPKTPIPRVRGVPLTLRSSQSEAGSYPQRPVGAVCWYCHARPGRMIGCFQNSTTQKDRAIVKRLSSFRIPDPVFSEW